MAESTVASLRDPPSSLISLHDWASTVPFMPWGMVAAITAIYTAARRGKAAGLTDDVRQVTGREPTSFEEFVVRHASLWRP